MRVRCPVLTPSGCEGCGHVFDATPGAAGRVDEGYVECPVCGLAFEPEPMLDTNTRERTGMMLYDICVTAEQIAALAAWVGCDGPDAAGVELVVDDRMLLAEQGDDRMAWDTGGEPASDAYLAAAPLDPAPPRGVRVVYVVRPFDAMQDVAAFADEDDALRFHDTFDAGDVGDIERVTVCDAAIAAEMVAQREAADEDDDEGTPLIYATEPSLTRGLTTFRQARADVVQPGEHVALARSAPYRLVTANAAAPGHKRLLTMDTGASYPLAADRLVWVKEFGRSAPPTPDEGTSCHDECQHPDLDHAASGEPCRGFDGLPIIDWAKLSDVSDVILPVPFRDTDRDGNPGEGERLDRIAHGSRIVDSAGNRYLLMGWGSMQGTVVLRDANGRTFMNEADERFKLG